MWLSWTCNIYVSTYYRYLCFPTVTFLFRENSFCTWSTPQTWHNTHTKTFQQLQNPPLKMMWNSYDEHVKVSPWLTFVACTVCLSARWQQADGTSSSADLWGVVRVFMWLWLWLCAVLWCDEVWWGWALPNEQLRRRRETVVSPVVAADRAQPLKFTTPGKSRQGPSTVAWPLRKPPAYYVITSYWAL